MRPRSVSGLLLALWQSPWLRLLVYLLLAVLALWLARLLTSVIVTGLVAYALAFLVHPVLNWLEQRGLKRVLGVMLVLIIELALLALLSWTVLAQVINLVSELPTLIMSLPELLTRMFTRLDGMPGLGNVGQEVSTFLGEQAQQLSFSIGPAFQRLVSSGSTLLDGVVSVVGWLGQAVLALILSVYFMLDYERVGSGLLRLLPRAWQPRARLLSDDVSVAFGGYLRGQLLIGLAVGVLVAIGLSLIGIPNALAIGLLAAVLDIVPYLGPIISALPALLLALPSGWLTMLLVVLVFIVANQLEGNFLSPYILGLTTNLSSASVLLAILTGLTLLGLVGALIAVPSATLLKRWLERYWLGSPAQRAPPDS